MKSNRLILFIIAALCSFQLQAQVYSARNLSIGIRGGLNITKLRPDTADFRNATLPFVGMELSTKLNDKMELVFGPQFNIKGTNNFNGSSKLRAYCIDAFLALSYAPVKDLKFEAGIEPSFMLYAEEQIFDSNTDSGYKKEKLEGFTNNYEVFAGVKLNMSPTLAIDLRYFIPYQDIHFNRLQIGFVYKMVEGHYQHKLPQ